MANKETKPADPNAVKKPRKVDPEGVALKAVKLVRKLRALDAKTQAAVAALGGESKRIFDFLVTPAK